MKCWNSERDAESRRLMHKVVGIIVAVQVGAAVKIYVAAVEAAQEKGKTGWNSGNHQK